MKPSLEDKNRTYGDLTTKAYSADTIRSLEEPFLEEGVPLMRMAADSVSTVARLMLREANIDPDTARIVLLAGAGNNGGDGLLASADLARRGADVTVIATGRSLDREGASALLRAGGVVMALDPLATIPDCDIPEGASQAADALAEAVELCQDADLVIDAMAGIGLRGALRGIPAALAIEIGEDGRLPHRLVPSATSDRRTPLVLAVDAPSGVDIDGGTLPGAYIPADVTVTMGALKPCLMLPPAAYICGRLVLVDFGFNTSALAPTVECMTSGTCASLLRVPRIDDTKYSRGVVGLVTGSDQYHGAALLSSTAAANTNVGMIRYHGPDSVGRLILSSIPEAVLGTGRVESWVLGSGVPTQAALNQMDDAPDSSRDGQRDLISSLLNRQAQDEEEGHTGTDPAMVIDAGALDLLPDRIGPLGVLTPHAGEMASLLGARGESVESEDVLAAPVQWAIRAWELTGATVLLKGAVTVVVGDDGTGQPRVMTTGFGPTWLSTAGSGDVLAGTIGALLAQNADLIEDEPEAVVDLVAAGTYLHGLAGALASESGQAGWEAPLVFQPRHPQAFIEQIQEESNEGSNHAHGPSGHPIRASEIAEHLPQAVGTLMSGHTAQDSGSNRGDNDQDRESSLFFEHSSLWF